MSATSLEGDVRQPLAAAAIISRGAVLPLTAAPWRNAARSDSSVELPGPLPRSTTLVHALPRSSWAKRSWIGRFRSASNLAYWLGLQLMPMSSIEIGSRTVGGAPPHLGETAGAELGVPIGARRA